MQKNPALENMAYYAPASLKMMYGKQAGRAMAAMIRQYKKEYKLPGHPTTWMP